MSKNLYVFVLFSTPCEGFERTTLHYSGALHEILHLNLNLNIGFKIMLIYLIYSASEFGSQSVIILFSRDLPTWRCKNHCDTEEIENKSAQTWL